MASKADLSFNWREPLREPLRTTQKTTLIHNFRTPDFVKKPEPTINPFPKGPWSDMIDYKIGLKCELCKTTIRKSIFPQKLDCGHIFCAECIHKHYTIEHKLKCAKCEKYINCEDEPGFCMHCYETTCKCDRDEHQDDSCPNCGINCYGHCEEDEPDCVHCGTGCDGSCGSLACGCIDVCRGRCERDEYVGGW